MRGNRIYKAIGVLITTHVRLKCLRHHLATSHRPKACGDVEAVRGHVDRVGGRTTVAARRHALRACLRLCVPAVDKCHRDDVEHSGDDEERYEWGGRRGVAAARPICRTRVAARVVIELRVFPVEDAQHAR